MAEQLSLITGLDQKRQELARLELELKQAQRVRLEKLYVETGFLTPDELILALAEHAGPEIKNALFSIGTPAAESQGARVSARTHAPRRPRAVVTESLRKQLAKELRGGRMTARQIASKFGVSASLVNQMKRKLGLTRRAQESRER